MVKPRPAGAVVGPPAWELLFDVGEAVTVARLPRSALESGTVGVVSAAVAELRMEAVPLLGVVVGEL